MCLALLSRVGSDCDLAGKSLSSCCKTRIGEGAVGGRCSSLSSRMYVNDLSGVGDGVPFRP
jgi:hypothetical protein